MQSVQLRRAVRRLNRDDLKRTNGDDRASFLKHNPFDLLMWWHLMDTSNLLFFAMAKIGDDNSASSSKKTGAVSKRARTKDTKSGKKKKDKIDESRLASLDSRILTMEAISKANLCAQCELLENEKFLMEMKRLDQAVNCLALVLIDDRIEKLDRELGVIDKGLTNEAMSPKKLMYATEEV